MAGSVTTNLKLRLSADLTADARYNLERIDALSAVYSVDTLAGLNLRAVGDILIEPQSLAIGGSGSGGSVSFGSANHELEAVDIYGPANFQVDAGLLDQSGTKYLRLRYASDLDGTADTTADRTLSFDPQGADREVILGGDVSLDGDLIIDGNLALLLGGDTTLTLPGSGTLLSHDSAATVSNKTIAAGSNTITGLGNANLAADADIDYSKLSLAGSILATDIAASAGIPYSVLDLTDSIVAADIAADAAIPYSKLDLAGEIGNEDVAADADIQYSKLDLTGSITNADVADGAAIAGTKISSDFGAQMIRTSGSLKLKRGLYQAGLEAGEGMSADVGWSLPAADGTSGQVLATDGVGRLLWASAETDVLAENWIKVGGPDGLATAVDTSAVGDFLVDPTTGITFKPGHGFPTSAVSGPVADIVGNGLGDLAFLDAVTDTEIIGPVTLSKLATLTSDRALVSDGSGVVSASSISTTKLGYLSDVTSALQAQLNGKQAAGSYAPAGNYITDLTGDVTASGPGSAAASIGAGKVTNTHLAGSIGYSKLSLSGAILATDLAGSIPYSKLSLAAGDIPYSKLTLTGAVLNADLAGSIAYGKLSLAGSITTGDLASGLLVPLTKGGTGQTTANAALNALLPSQTSAASLYLGSNGTDSSWSSPVPAGVISMFGGSVAPTGYLFCNGVPVSRTTYAALFAVIGTTYGVGNGTTTFNLPDFQSRSPIGAGAGSGLTVRTMGGTFGAETNALLEIHAPFHTHTMAHTHTASQSTSTSNDGTHVHGVSQSQLVQAPAGASGYTSGGSAFNNAGSVSVTSGSSAHTHAFSVSMTSSAASNATTSTGSGSGGSFNITDPKLVVNFIIKT